MDTDTKALLNAYFILGLLIIILNYNLYHHGALI